MLGLIGTHIASAIDDDRSRAFGRRSLSGGPSPRLRRANREGDR